MAILKGISLNPETKEPLLEEEETMHKTEENISLLLPDGTNEGLGILFITTKRVIWVQKEESKSVAVYFPDIMCHAIARTAFQQPCLYCQLDTEDETCHEMRFVPEDPQAVDRLYQAFCEGALLNPDPVVEDDEGEFFYNQEEVEMGVEQAQKLEDWDSKLQLPDPEQMMEAEPGQFDDPDETPEDGDMQMDKKRRTE